MNVVHSVSVVTLNLFYFDIYYVTSFKSRI